MRARVHGEPGSNPGLPHSFVTANSWWQAPEWRRVFARNGIEVMTDWIRIDGSEGEGGGQILRTALALSLVTGRPFQIEGIRAGRAKPGLLRQHLTAAHAAAQVAGARMSGA